MRPEVCPTSPPPGGYPDTVSVHISRTKTLSKQSGQELSLTAPLSLSSHSRSSASVHSTRSPAAGRAGSSNQNHATPRSSTCSRTSCQWKSARTAAAVEAIGHEERRVVHAHAVEEAPQDVDVGACSALERRLFVVGPRHLVGGEELLDLGVGGRRQGRRGRRRWRRRHRLGWRSRLGLVLLLDLRGVGVRLVLADLASSSAISVGDSSAGSGAAGSAAGVAAT